MFEISFELNFENRQKISNASDWSTRFSKLNSKGLTGILAAQWG